MALPLLLQVALVEETVVVREVEGSVTVIIAVFAAPDASLTIIV